MRGKAFTDANRKKFLEAYAQCGVIGEAARRAKVGRSSHYEWMQDPEYQREFEAADESATDLLINEARRRAHEGWEEPIVYQGEISYKLDKNGKRTNKPVTVRKFDSTLLMFLIKGRKPEIYRETFKGEIKHTGTISRGPDLSTLSDEQLDHLKALTGGSTANGSGSEASQAILEPSIDRSGDPETGPE